MEKLKMESYVSKLQDAITCVCGHCNNKIALDVYARYYSIDTTKQFSRKNFVYYTGQCPFCGCPVIYKFSDASVLPMVSNFENINYLPDEIEQLYSECRNAFGIGAYTCCVITLRTLMAHVAVDQGGVPNKSFIDYVNYLQQNCLPSKTNNVWVDKIRQLGNDVTHNCKIASKEDAEIAMKFTIAILKNVYEFPNSVQ